jgi:glycosyltransferase involved in cell wall biosynthesis
MGSKNSPVIDFSAGHSPLVGANGNGSRPNDPLRVLHIINDLSIGGTEMTLYKLLSRTNRDKFRPTVISLNGIGTLGDRVKQLGIEVEAVGMKQSGLRIRSLLRLARIARRTRPDLIQGWMYHGNLAAQFAGLFVSRPVSILWNIRQSLYTLDDEKPATARAIRLGARLSRWPSMILNNSQKSVSQHAAIGYETNRTVVIPNGFDTESFIPSEESRVSVRAELGIPADTILVGRIGRYHHTKDHPTFLRAAALLLKDYPNTQFLLAGKDIDWNNGKVRTLVQDLRLVERVHLLGERLDIPRLTAALDIATSSSHAEGFPNVIGEAMSCEVPCVVTDVGDSVWLVGDTGRAVPSQDPEALAAAWKAVIGLGSEGRRDLGAAARARVMRRFSLASVVEQYESLYQTVTAESMAPSTKSTQLSTSAAGTLPAPEFERVDEQFSKITRQASSRG